MATTATTNQPGAAPAIASATKPNLVVVHPVVLLSAVDHYNRIAKDTRKRVVGILLGESYQGRIDVTNSYAVPFEEDDNDPKVWFFDHNFHENMYAMFKKVNARERVVGWYSTGPRVKAADLAIHSRIQTYNKNAALVIIDVRGGQQLGIPTEAYIAEEEIDESAKHSKPKLSFKHIPSEIGAYEAEEIGVEHLLRDIKDTSVSTLTQHIDQKVTSLKGLVNHLKDMEKYLGNVLAGKLPINHTILGNFQDMFNLLPNVHVESMVKSMSIKTNDMLLAVYLSTLIRSVIALHDLINNKIANREAEKKADEEADGKENKKAEDGKKTDGDKKDDAKDGEKNTRRGSKSRRKSSSSGRRSSSRRKH